MVSRALIIKSVSFRSSRVTLLRRDHVSGFDGRFVDLSYLESFLANPKFLLGIRIRRYPFIR